MGWHLSWEAHLSTSGFLRGGVGPHQGNSPSSCLPPVLGPFQGLYGGTPRSPGFFGSGGRNGRPWKRQLRHRTGHPSLCLRSAQASHSVLGQLPSPNAGSPQPPPARGCRQDRQGGRGGPGGGLRGPPRGLLSGGEEAKVSAWLRMCSGVCCPPGGQKGAQAGEGGLLPPGGQEPPACLPQGPQGPQGPGVCV